MFSKKQIYILERHQRFYTGCSQNVAASKKEMQLYDIEHLNFILHPECSANGYYRCAGDSHIELDFPKLVKTLWTYNYYSIYNINTTLYSSDLWLCIYVQFTIVGQWSSGHFSIDGAALAAIVGEYIP